MRAVFFASDKAVCDTSPILNLFIRAEPDSSPGYNIPESIAW